jgi:anti-sigma factor RsiW
MTECTNLDVRDLLPERARGTLSGPSLAMVDAHLATCASCRAELGMVRSAQAVLGNPPSIDAARIAAAMVRSKALRRDATVAINEARRRRTWGMSRPSRRVWLAAASLVAIAGAAILATNAERPSAPGAAPSVAHVPQPTTAPVVATIDSSPVRPAPVRPAGRTEIVMGGGVSDLADADLESLLQVLDDVDAQLDVEPAVLLPVLEGEV